MISRPGQGCHNPNSGVTTLTAANPGRLQAARQGGSGYSTVEGEAARPTPIGTATNTVFAAIKTGSNAVTIVIAP